jgi:hypothetical protein
MWDAAFIYVDHGDDRVIRRVSWSGQDGAREGRVEGERVEIGRYSVARWTCEADGRF